jgi:hypothetical protein
LNVPAQVVAKILAKALMSIPSTDFLLCTYLISEQIKVDAAVEALYQLSNMLEQAEFKQFWQTYTDCAASPLLASIPDFEEKICEFAIGLLTASHQVCMVQAYVRCGGWAEMRTSAHRTHAHAGSGCCGRRWTSPWWRRCSTRRWASASS